MAVSMDPFETPFVSYARYLSEILFQIIIICTLVAVFVAADALGPFQPLCFRLRLLGT
jgi:hypothetical protein